MAKNEPEKISLEEPKILFNYCRAAIGAQPNEIFKVIYLDSRYRVIDLETLTEGTIDRATVYPRKVMESALKKRASILVFAHNHPDGNISPSEQDKTITKALILAAKALNITILDHLTWIPMEGEEPNRF